MLDVGSIGIWIGNQIDFKLIVRFFYKSNSKEEKVDILYTLRLNYCGLRMPSNFLAWDNCVNCGLLITTIKKLSIIKHVALQNHKQTVLQRFY